MKPVLEAKDHICKCPRCGQLVRGSSFSSVNESVGSVRAVTFNHCGAEWDMPVAMTWRQP